MALPVPRSLKHIADEVRARCGFANQVMSSAQAGLLASWVSEAQNDIYWQHEFFNERTETLVSTVASQAYVEWPAVVDPQRLIELSILVDGTWLPLAPKGIGLDLDTYQDEESFPLRYDTGPTLTLWPTPDAIYSIKIEHYARPRVLRSASASRINNTIYSLGAIVFAAEDTSTGLAPITWPAPLPVSALHVSHFVYECTTEGTSTASTTLTWPVVDAATLSDGTVTWTARQNTVTMPDSLVLKLALYKAKLHYRQPDAEEAMGSFQAELAARQAGEKVGERYVQALGRRRGAGLAAPPWIPPVRV